GPVAGTMNLNDMAMDWRTELPECVTDKDSWAARFTTTLTAPKSGAYTFILDGARDAVFCIDDNVVISRYENEMDPDTASVKIMLEEGKEYRLRFHVIPSVMRCRGIAKLRWLTPTDTVNDSFDDLMQKAKEADAVIYVGGLSHQEDTEGKDKIGIDLAGRQDEVIAQLAEARPDTVVLMTGGSPYAMPWVDKVNALIHIWYGGMEVGNAAAEIVFGKVNPSGKLPFTFPVKLEDSPAHYLDDYHADVCYYKEDIYVGYRWFEQRDINPLFPFGHGLSYSSFKYSNLAVSTGGEGAAVVSFDIENTGTVAGAEVAQLYVGDSECSVGRPKKELKNFAKLSLKPGEKKSVNLTLTEKDLSFFHPSLRRWVAEPGEFSLHVGSSSTDIRLEGKFDYKG
ncbi:MAG: glycoside hydrolase family 3 C-terminal domain-containing protein, partial [Planctomycetes bacterium]|nr:glycoside hydrolase family 3 C-terminal domain-containing protein [Planctomycetota bacterium]